MAFPYYGDKLDGLTRQFDIPLTSDVRARGGGPLDEEFLVFQAEVAEAVRLRAGVTDEQVDAEYGPNPRPRGPLNWEWVHAILSAIDKHGGGMSQRALEVVHPRRVRLHNPDRRARGDRLDRVRSAERRARGCRRSFTGLGRRLQRPAFRYPGTQRSAVRDGWLAPRHSRHSQPVPAAQIAGGR